VHRRAVRRRRARVEHREGLAMTTPEIIDELEWARRAKPSLYGPPDCTSQKDFFASFDLEDCERWIDGGIAEFLNAGKVLMQIHDRHLYREAGYTSFDT